MGGYRLSFCIDNCGGVVLGRGVAAPRRPLNSPLSLHRQKKVGVFYVFLFFFVFCFSFSLVEFALQYSLGLLGFASVYLLFVNYIVRYTTDSSSLLFCLINIICSPFFCCSPLRFICL